MDFDAVQLFAAGTMVATGATDASVAVPNAADGKKARFCMLVVDTGSCFVRFDGTAADSTNGTLITTHPVFIHTRGIDTIHYIENGSAANLSISPIEA